MASIIENSDDEHTVAISPLVDSVDDQNSQEQSSAPVETKQPEVPSKYQGKSVDDLVRMHQEAEKLIGRQGSEVGELRKVVDDFIKTQSTINSKAQEKEQEDEDEIDYFADPSKAIDKRVEKHPAVVEAKEASKAMKRAEALSKIKEAHPDFEAVVADDSFIEWIKSSKFRLEQFARADSQFDYEAGNDLLDLWKERKESTRKVVETAQQDRSQQLKAASNYSQGSNEAPSKKIYRRSDIIELMRNNPDKYEAMYPEIEAAYREKRVR